MENEDGEGFQEVKLRKQTHRKPRNQKVNQAEKEQKPQNQFLVLQEDDMGEAMRDITSEMGGEKDKELEGEKMNNMVTEVDQGVADTMQMVEQTIMEIDNQKEDLSAEKQVMKRYRRNGDIWMKDSEATL